MCQEAITDAFLCSLVFKMCVPSINAALKALSNDKLSIVYPVKHLVQKEASRILEICLGEELVHPGPYSFEELQEVQLWNF